ncbi:enolase-phosphatase E1 [Episyrphus balteatus]|uniref:enolase-phosphatase E1 n=1 Tax=Episyrphus balteatus TaxID=286459 RepID=UPI002486BAB3|nr:enolase-phosphatase E1 [Episyrphus balteatus]
MDEDINMPESSSFGGDNEQENTHEEGAVSNPATSDDHDDAAAATTHTDAVDNGGDGGDEEEEDNTNMSADDGAVEMLQEHVYSNDDEEEGAADDTSKIGLAPEPNIDENTILLPVAGENGFSGEETAIGFNASDFLQEEEDVIDPMATLASRREEKIISQVPKKRRIPDAVRYDDDDDDSPERNQKRRGRKPGTKVINGQVIYPSDKHGGDSSKRGTPRTTTLSAKSTLPKFTPKPVKGAKVSLGQVDENQCRVCTTTKDLVSIFKKEYQKTYAEKLMAICPLVNIQRKDFLPQFICKICLSSVNAAFALKGQCEQTDAELRVVLETSIKKTRKVTNYALDSDPEDIPDAPQDQDFNLSDASPPSAEETDSDVPLLKKRPRRGSRKSRSSKIKSEKTEKKLKSPAIKKESPLKKAIKPDPDLNDSKNSELDGDPTAPSGAAAGDFSSGSEENYSPPKRRRGKGKKSKSSEDRPPVNLTCNVCNETLNSREELRDHKKQNHSSFDCELCGRKFKMQSSLKTHMEKHTSLKILNCEPCNMHFPNKTERRRHMQEAHKDTVAQFSCEKCKRAFTSETRLQKHTESNCPGFDTSQKKRGDLESLSMGKDLFKCVAPLTTTYWSDSFSD